MMVKQRKGRLALVVVALAVPGAATTQSTTSVGTADVVSTIVAGALFLTPHLFIINEGPPTCAPCPRSDVPAFDRWAIRVPREGANVASSAILLGVAAFTWADAFDEGRVGQAEIAASVQAASWAVGATELLKALAGRNRPVMYTPEATQAAANLGSRRSWPSGHSAAAAALATSYVLSRGKLGTPKVRIWVVAVAATSVGALRVVAGRHFPSDVASGAALGIGGALVVHSIKF